MNTKRTFLERSLSSGMEVGLITADDVLRHAKPEVLAGHLPKDLLAKLLKACLAAPEMTPALVVETLGTVAMAANLPPEVIWSCVAEVAQRELGETADGEDKSSSRGKKAQSKKGSSRSEAKPEPAAAAKSDPTAKTTAVEAAPLPPVAEPPRAKPNAKVRGKTKPEPDEPPRLPGVPRPGTDTDRASRARTAPVVPRSEFDVDTDVGEDWDVDDDIVDIEEADAVGAVALDDPAFDWKGDDETLAKEPKR